MSHNETSHKDFEWIVSETASLLTRSYSADELSLSRYTAGNLQDQKMVELEAVLANTSFAHEYALLQLAQTAGERERDALDEEMDRYHETYATTRQALEEIDRDRLLKFETTLMWQKNVALRGYVI